MVLSNRREEAKATSAPPRPAPRLAGVRGPRNREVLGGDLQTLSVPEPAHTAEPESPTATAGRKSPPPLAAGERFPVNQGARTDYDSRHAPRPPQLTLQGPEPRCVSPPPLPSTRQGKFCTVGWAFFSLRFRSVNKRNRCVVCRRISYFPKNGTIFSKKILTPVYKGRHIITPQGLSGMTGLSEGYLNLLSPRIE